MCKYHTWTRQNGIHKVKNKEQKKNQQKTEWPHKNGHFCDLHLLCIYITLLHSNEVFLLKKKKERNKRSNQTARILKKKKKKNKEKKKKKSKKQL